MLGSNGASLVKRHHLESGTNAFADGKKSAGGSVSASSADTRRKGPVGVSTPDVSQSTASSSSSSLVLQVGMLLHFLDQWISITSSRLVLNMVQGLHLQFRSHPPLFHNFCQFSVKAVVAHHPIIQNEVDGLLSKGAVEAASGGAGFYFSVFVAP